MLLLPLASVAANILVGFICVAAAVVAGVAAFYFIRAKNREAIEPALAASGEAAPNGLGEMRELTSRIEDIVTQQQDNGETQRAHLSRKIDGIRESVESQHHAVTGLRHELRHEVQRRDEEMLQIRSQIESVREGIGLPPATRAALPPGPTAADLGAPEAQAAMMPISFDESPFGDNADVDTGGDSGPDRGFFASMAFGEEASGENDDEAPDSAFAPMGFAFDEEPSVEPAADSPFAPMTFEADAPELPTLDPEAPMVLSFMDDDEFEPLEPLPDTAAPSMFEEQMPEASTPMTFAAEDDAPATSEPVVPPTPFEVVSFLEPEPAAATPAPEASSPAPEASSPVAQPEPVAVAPEAAPAPQAELPELPEVAVPEAAALEVDVPIAAQPMAAAPEAADRPPAPRPPTFEPTARREASGVAAGHGGASLNGESAFPPVTFEPPVVEDAPAPSPTAWISRPDRAPETDPPTEIIGGIAVECVGDVPPSAPTSPLEAPISPLEPVSFDGLRPAEPKAPAEPVLSIPEPPTPEAAAPVTAAPGVNAPQPSPEPEAALPEAALPEAAPPEAEPDEFPSPVVASDLAVKEGIDFGLDIEAELAAMGAEPLDLPSLAGVEASVPEPVAPEPVAPEPVAAGPNAPEPLAPEASGFHNAPVPPHRSEPVAESEPATVPPVAAAPEAAPPEAEAAFDRTMPLPTPMDASEFISMTTPSAPSSAPPPQPSAPAPEPVAASPAPEASAPVTPPEPVAASPDMAVPETAPVAVAPEADETPEVPSYVAPEGAEDLTVITSIDEDVQRALYMAGVLSLDEVARWGRTEARRVSSEVGVAEATIMNQWVFEAQAALFDRYSSR